MVTSLNEMATLGSQASLAVAGPNTGVFGQNVGTTKIGHVTTGGVISRTAMVTLQLEVFPQSSEAVHVLVTLNAPGQLPGVVTVVKEMVTLASHTSVAVATPKVGVAGQLMGDVTIGQVMDGGTLSETVIVLLQKEVFPQLSVATQVRVTL